jgi:hypothetical protein
VVLNPTQPSTLNTEGKNEVDKNNYTSTPSPQGTKVMSVTPNPSTPSWQFAQPSYFKTTGFNGN